MSKAATKTTGAKTAWEVWERFADCAAREVPTLNETMHVRNPAYKLIFEDYWVNASRNVIGVKVSEKREGDAENKMIFTSLTTGAKLTIYGKW